MNLILKNDKNMTALVNHLRHDSVYQSKRDKITKDKSYFIAHACALVDLIDWQTPVDHFG